MPTYLPDSPVQTHYALGKGVYSAGTEEERFTGPVSAAAARAQSDRHAARARECPINEGTSVTHFEGVHPSNLARRFLSSSEGDYSMHEFARAE